MGYLKVRILVILASLLLPLSATSQVPLKDIKIVFNAVSAVYAEKLNTERSYLRFNPLDHGLSPWDFEYYVRASYVRLHTEGLGEQLAQQEIPRTIKTIHTVNVYRGYANLNGMTRDGIALVVCHELGHAFSVKNLKSNGSIMEGEADYYSTSSCIRQVFAILPEKNDLQNSALSFEEGALCQETRSAKTSTCLRTLRAIKSSFMISILHETSVLTSLLDSDNSVVSYMNEDLKFYPAPQCRIDTLLAGALGRPRPLCWFFDNTPI